MEFHIWQKVVCIDDTGFDWDEEEVSLGCAGPRRGNVYTVRGFYMPTSIWLEEIKNPLLDYDDDGIVGLLELSFRVERFRPLDEKKTDISIFTAMLTDTKVDA